ncbi:MAG: glycosyltransferase [Caldilineaceae bacterium]|nr:glycosyltransferase [Caldilineaceae bacterium]
MRIALFSDIYKPHINGVVNHVGLLKEHFDRWGEQVYLFVPEQDKKTEDESNVIRLPSIPIADTGYHLTVRVDSRCRDILKRMDVIHVHHPFISGSFGLTFSRRYEIPLVFTSHTRYDLYVQQYLPLLPETLSDTALQAFFQRFSQRCSAIIAPSKSAATVMQTWGIQGRVAVIPNGIELGRFHRPEQEAKRQEFGIPQEAVVGVYVGRISQEKAVDRLLRIAAALKDEVPRLHLLLVGGGPSLEECRKLAGESGLEGRVTFTGPISYERIGAVLGLADFFVSASVSEVHPLTFIEAAAAGLPAIGIDSPGVADMIADEETGFLTENNDLSFGLRIMRIARDAEMRKKMGLAARQYSQRFSAHHNAREVLALYQTVQEE